MDSITAKRIGATHGLRSVTVALILMYLVVSLLFINSSFTHPFLWFVEFGYGFHILAGMGILYLSGWIFGRIAGKEILLDQKNCSRSGLKFGILTLLIPVIFSVLLVFFSECAAAPDQAYDYLVKPGCWIVLIGIFPALITGYLFGRRVSKAR